MQNASEIKKKYYKKYVVKFETKILAFAYWSVSHILLVQDRIQLRTSVNMVKIIP